MILSLVKQFYELRRLFLFEALPNH